MATASPPSPDSERTGLPHAPPLLDEIPLPRPSVQPGLVAAGIGIALAGHVPASGVWFLSFYSFVYYASPDSLFMVDCLVIVLELALFACCVVPGAVMVIRGDRGLGLGLLIGWLTGILALALGTDLIFYSV